MLLWALPRHVRQSCWGPLLVNIQKECWENEWARRLCSRDTPWRLQDILEDLFLGAEVDLVLTGHVHLYARTCSVRADRCVREGDGGITHITLGARHGDGSLNTHRLSVTSSVQPPAHPISGRAPWTTAATAAAEPFHG